MDGSDRKNVTEGGMAADDAAKMFRDAHRPAFKIHEDRKINLSESPAKPESSTEVNPRKDTKVVPDNFGAVPKDMARSHIPAHQRFTRVTRL